MRKSNLAKILKHEKEPVVEVLKDIISACQDVKAKDITALNLTGLSDVANYYVIASGRSDRQVQSIANRVMEDMHMSGIEPTSIEGLEAGHWVLLDYGDVVIHVFYEPLREHYDLENMWQDAPRIDVPEPRAR